MEKNVRWREKWIIVQAIGASETSDDVEILVPAWWIKVVRDMWGRGLRLKVSRIGKQNLGSFLSALKRTVLDARVISDKFSELWLLSYTLRD